MDQFVWVGDDEPQRWLRGGSYLVARRIRMLIETWDRSSLGDQEETIGRDKTERRAARRATHEHDPVDLAAKQPDGALRDPADAHIRLAASPRPTAASGSCAAATPSPTASTR